MKTLVNPVVWLVLAVLAASLFFLTGYSERTPQQVGSTVKVLLATGHGSGVNLGGGFILTAGHVSKGTKTVKVKTDDGVIRDGEVLWSNFDPGGNSHDVSLVYVDPAKLAGVQAAKLSCAPNYVGQNLRIVGNPIDVEFVTTWGRIGSLRHSKPAPWALLTVLDATATNGVSGGPVFDDATGEVIGLLVSGYPGTGYSMMVPGAEICRMLARTA